MEPALGNDKPKNKRPSSYYFETSDLVIIALFAALGGLSSSVIANVARAIFFPLGIPGSGQIASGLHVIWFVLIYFLVNEKIGAVFLAGVIKGIVELFSGNTLVVVAIALAVGAALVFEVSIYLLTRIFRSRRIHHVTIAFSAGLASVSNIIIQIETFIGRNFPPEIFLLIITFSFISGIILGGYLGIIIYRVFEQTAILDWRRTNN
ncbi:MAG: ECF transporter S component [Candidatus Hodarchaeales archaeon]|jgi:energy-coupling factor transport system substrate-specific component